MSDVVTEWHRLCDVLRAHAPLSYGAIQPRSADPSGPDEVRERLDIESSEEVVQWFGLHGGVVRTIPAGLIFAGYFASSATAAIEGTRVLREIYEDIDPEEVQINSDGPHVAGSSVGTWLDDYVMIADDAAGGALFVDLRPGAKHGCIRSWSSGGGADLNQELVADNVASFLASVTTSIRSGAVLYPWRITPRVNDGVLEWQQAAG